MNYGKKNASKRQKEITSKDTMQKKKVGVRLFKAVLICCLLLVVVGAVGGGIFLKKIIDNAPEVSPKDVAPSGYTTFVYASDEKTVTERFVGSGSNRVYKKIDQIPKDLQHAFVAIEDSRFYDHNGIDPQGILRAGVVGLTTGNFSEGASTLTQQLIKNNVFPEFTEEKTFYDKLERKVQEQYLALEIEKQMDKKQIIEAYMNTINLGQNTLGVQSAATRYFNKDVSKLTLSECAVIAGITQNPARFNPVTNPDDNAKRRKKVLKNMLDQGYIKHDAYEEALKDPVYDRIQNVNSNIGEESPYTYFIDALSDQVMEDLKEQLGYTDTQAYNAVYSGGLSIYSTQDMDIQKICDEEMNDDSNYPSSKSIGVSYALTIRRADGSVENFGSTHLKKYREDKHNDDQGLLYSSKKGAKKAVKQFRNSLLKEGDTYDENLSLSPQPQASLVLMDQYTGQVKALVGGRGKKDSSRSLNRAYKGSKRQPGSAFKIVSTYAPALDSRDKTLATSIKDEPYEYSNGRPVKNWWGSNYRGEMTIRKAIEQSANICAVKMLTEITPKVGFDYLENFGFTTLIEKEKRNGKVYSDIQQALALGGVTDGVYNIEMAGAYACIANGGVYNKPVLYTKIVDHDGNVLLENTPETHTVLKDTTAALLTSAMEGVVTSGTGTRARLDNMPVAGKTGTTTSSVDVWFCGYTPYYTCSIWGGYDDNKSLSDGNYHKNIWRKVMNRVHKDLEYKDFEMPDDLEEKKVCSKTGLLAVNGCSAYTEYFAPGTAPSQSCSGHVSDEPDEKDDEKEDDDPNKKTPDANTPSKEPSSGNGGNSSGDKKPNGGNGDGGNSGGGGGNTGGGDGGNSGGGGGNTGGGDGGNSGGGGGNTGGDPNKPAT